MIISNKNNRKNLKTTKIRKIYSLFFKCSLKFVILKHISSLFFLTVIFMTFFLVANNVQINGF